MVKQEISSDEEEANNLSPAPLASTTSGSSSQSISSIILSQNSIGQPHFNLSQNTMTVLMDTLKKEIGNEVSSQPPDDRSALTQSSDVPVTEQPGQSRDCAVRNPVPLPLYHNPEALFRGPYAPDPPQLTFAVPGVPGPAASVAHFQHVLSQQLTQASAAISEEYPPPSTAPAISPLTIASPGLVLVAQPVSSATQATISTVPNSKSFKGEYGFEIFFDKLHESGPKKGVSYTFSETMNKLYARPKIPCPINFKAQPPPCSVIRAMVVYSRPADAGEIVRRCNNHALQDTHPARHHFIHAQHPYCQYIEEPDTGRHSITVPWESQAEEAGHTTLLFQFMCFNSCVTSANRGPLQLVFTLEHNGIIVGRQSVELRTCAAPCRDKEHDEKQALLRYGKKRRRLAARPPKGSTWNGMLSTNVTGPHTIVRNGLEAEYPSSAIMHSFTTDSEEDDGSDDNTTFLLKIRGREIYSRLKAIYDDYRTARKYQKLIANGTMSGEKRC